MILPVSRTTEINPVIPAEAADSGFLKKHGGARYVGKPDKTFKSEIGKHTHKKERDSQKKEEEEESELLPEIFAIFQNKDFRILLDTFRSCRSFDLIEFIRNIRIGLSRIELAQMPFESDSGNQKISFPSRPNTIYNQSSDFHKSAPGTVLQRYI
ncbi:MAG: hypothetical protein EA364_09255 [Balneolaceae bacterium]|nr:MAG: hypothetical protein EA364_09255 [Balneolaceae bacterium]